MRAAIYYAPTPDGALARLAADWLGRDAFTGEARPTGPDHDAVVAEPARYGFHATLKAPFGLADGATLDTVTARLDSFCAGRTGPTIRSLTLTQLGPFLALVPAEPEPALATLEADVLSAFEPFRAPLDEAARARRRPDRLTPRQLDHLHRWGYPFVLDEHRFHMTLTGPLGQDAVHPDAGTVRRDIEARFAGVLGRPLPLEGLALFVEPEPGAPFRVHAYRRFGSPSTSQPAAMP